MSDAEDTGSVDVSGPSSDGSDDPGDAAESGSPAEPVTDPTGTAVPSTPPSDARWLYAWGGANVAIGVSSLLVPLYVVQLGGGAFALGLLWFATSLAMVPGALGVGRIVDRTGRYTLCVLGSLAGVTGALAAIPFIGTVTLVVVADAVLWLFVASATPVATMLILADAPESAWNARIAQLNKYQGYGWALGLVLGAVWTRALAGVPVLLVQRSLLGVGAALLAVCTVAAVRLLPADVAPAALSVDGPMGGSDLTHDAASAGRLDAARGRNPFRWVRGALSPALAGQLASITRVPRPRRLLRTIRQPLGLYLFAVALFFGGFAVFSAPLPDFLTRIGFGDDAIFALYVVASVATAAFYVGAGELAGRYDLRALQSGALGMRGVVFPAIGIVGISLSVSSPVGFLLVAGLFALVGLSLSVIIVTANSLVVRYASPGRRGAVLGLYTALSAGAGGVGGLLGGWLASTFDYVLTFTVASALVIVGAGLVLGLDRLTSVESAGESESA